MYLIVIDISNTRFVLLFIEGLAKPLKGFVKSYNPTNFQDAMNKTRDFQDALPSMTYPPKVSIPSKVPEMKFQYPNGKLVVLKGINTYPNQVVSSHSLRYIIRHGDIEWDVECTITSQGTTIGISHHHEDI